MHLQSMVARKTKEEVWGGYDMLLSNSFWAIPRIRVEIKLGTLLEYVY